MPKLSHIGLNEERYGDPGVWAWPGLAHHSTEFPFIRGPLSGWRSACSARRVRGEGEGPRCTGRPASPRPPLHRQSCYVPGARGVLGYSLALFGFLFLASGDGAETGARPGAASPSWTASRRQWRQHGRNTPPYGPGL